MYAKLCNLVVYGKGAEGGVATALTGLPDARAQWYRARYSLNRKGTLYHQRAYNRDREWCKQTKRKLHELGSTSTEPLGDGVDDGDDTNDDGDDDEHA